MVPTRRALDDVRQFAVEFVLNGADDLLEHVLEGDHPRIVPNSSTTIATCVRFF